MAAKKKGTECVKLYMRKEVKLLIAKMAAQAGVSISQVAVGMLSNIARRARPGRVVDGVLEPCPEVVTISDRWEETEAGPRPGDVLFELDVLEHQFRLRRSAGGSGKKIQPLRFQDGVA